MGLGWVRMLGQHRHCAAAQALATYC
jgi:hypothetical protein